MCTRMFIVVLAVGAKKNGNKLIHLLSKLWSNKFEDNYAAINISNKQWQWEEHL